MVKPLVSVIALGGTIASTREAADGTRGGAVPSLSAQDLLGALPGIDELCRVTAVQFRQVPSVDLTLSDMIELAGVIDAAFDSGAAGVVVTQGTDTMCESAYALSLLVGDRGPVAVTAAMRNASMAGADGPANLVAALRVAACAEARQLGVVVVMNDEIHDPRFVRKAHSTSVAAFQSYPGRIGWVSEDYVTIAASPRDAARLPRPAADRPVPPVAMLSPTLGDDGRMLSTLQELGYAGLVIDALGGGHVPSSWVGAVGAVADVMPVVYASKTGAGRVLERTYRHAGSEAELLARGLLPAGILDGPKARILLTLLLMTDRDPRRRWHRFALVRPPGQLPADRGHEA